MVSNTWKVVETLNQRALNILDAKWNALRARFYSLRFRIKGGVREFFDASSQQWTRLTTEMDQFADASKANFREGIEWTFDRVSNTWKAVASEVNAAGSKARARDAKRGYTNPIGPVKDRSIVARRTPSYNKAPRTPSYGPRAIRRTPSYSTPASPSSNYKSVPASKYKSSPAASSSDYKPLR